MITIQSVMLVVLGVLLASLVVLVIAPAYRRRTVRLTTEEIRRSIPITEAEIRADKDRLRAQFAIRVHKLEAQGEQQKLAAARRMVELNQRDAKIAALETEVEQLKAGLEENANARRVLEHTVTDRMPRLEMRLAEARQLLSSRDVEVTALKSETTRSIRALDEAMQINAQQRSEIDRMSTVLNTRAHISREGISDARFDSEIALKAEIESLRATTREQASLISRISAGGSDGAGAAVEEAERLARDLASAQVALSTVKATAEADTSARAAAETQIAQLKSKIEDQAAELSRLTAALKSYEDGEGTDKPSLLRDSRMASKARISSLQAQVATQTETIQRLRAELASNNERLARQAAHFMEEMRRLGSGTRPVSGEARRQREAPQRRTLADRVSEARQLPAKAPGAPNAAEGGRVAEYLKSMSADGDATPTAKPAGAAAGAEPAIEPAVAAAGERRAVEPKPKGRLLDRISSISKA